MKAVAFPFALLLACLSHAQVKMSFSLNGQPVGEATLRQEIDSTGRLHQTVVSKISAGGRNATINQVMLTDPAGRSIREIVIQESGSSKSTVTVTYGPKSITISKTQNGKTTSSVVAIPKGNLEDSSSFWFIKTHPKVGASVSHLHYDVDASKWTTETATYVGDDVAPGTKMKGHHIKESDGQMWLDDKGLPIRMEFDQSGMKMELTRKS